MMCVLLFVGDCAGLQWGFGHASLSVPLTVLGHTYMVVCQQASVCYYQVDGGPAVLSVAAGLTATPLGVFTPLLGVGVGWVGCGQCVCTVQPQTGGCMFADAPESHNLLHTSPCQRITKHR